MNVLMLSTTDISGGACRGAYKLFTALHGLEGVGPRMLVQEKHGGHPGVERLAVPLRSKRKWMDLCGLWRNYPGRVRTPFSVHRVPGGVARAVKRRRPDIVHLNWVSAGFVSIESLAGMNVPIVWTFRDMWPMTGGCHYSQGCEGYRGACGCCPILGSEDEKDLSRRIFVRKARAWKNLDIHVVAPSRWIGDCARQSALFRDADITVIPNGVDVEKFSPMDRGAARRILDLPESGKVLLFGADHALEDPRKGFGYLRQALRGLKSQFAPDELSLLMFGADLPAGHGLGFEARSLGRVDGDDLLRTAYCAADVFCAPSVQENMANTVLESLACGTPVAAFDIGGMPDMIGHGVNGVLATPRDAADLARNIILLLRESGGAGRAARQSAVDRFDINHVARQYAGLYARMLEG